MKKPLIKKANRRKINLIKKYAKIRFRRFWNEWGITKEQFVDLLGCISLFAFIYVAYIVGYMFL